MMCMGVTSSAHAGEWQQATLGGVTTQLYRPDAEGVAGEGRPLFIALHGCAQQATALKDFGNWSAAEEYGAVIALPSAPNGGVYAGCWDYYGAGHTRGNRHNGPLLAMVQALLDDAELKIDPAQVYITGLSSGGAQAGVMGCLAPEIFAGVGINAGPAVGTSEADIASATGTPEGVANTCTTLAGAESGAFSTQLTAVVYGDKDVIVAPGYGRLNALSRAGLYSVPDAPDAFTLDGLPGYAPSGQGQIWFDADGPRVSLIEVTGMGHAWPAGTGEGFENQFVAAEGLDWFSYLMQWFTAHNRRLDGFTPEPPGVTPEPTPTSPPTLTLTDVTSTAGCLQASGQLSTLEGDPLSGPEVQVLLVAGDTSALATVELSGRWQGEVCGLESGCYQLGVRVTSPGGQDALTSDPVPVVATATPDEGNMNPAPSGVVAEVEDTLVGHTGRLSVYPGGYGVADTTYLDLLDQFGTMTPFTLYQSADGDWYLDPANIPGGAPEMPMAETPSCDEVTPPSTEPEAPGEMPQPGQPGGGGGATAGGPAVRTSGGCQGAPGGGGLWWMALPLLGLRRRR